MSYVIIIGYSRVLFNKPVAFLVFIGLLKERFVSFGNVTIIFTLLRSLIYSIYLARKGILEFLLFDVSSLNEDVLSRFSFTRN